MAGFLLDENISPVVAEQCRLKLPTAKVTSIYNWLGGELLGTDDEAILRVAHHEGLTLITYDVSTIQPLLKTWAEEGRDHAGVVFVGDKSIAGNDYGGLVKAILQVSSRFEGLEFTNGVLFLNPV